MTATPTITETQHGPVTVTEIGTDDDYSVTLAIAKFPTQAAELADTFREFGAQAHRIGKAMDHLSAHIILSEWVEKITRAK